MADDIVVIDSNEEEVAVVDDGRTVVSEENAQIAEEAAEQARQWAVIAEQQADIATDKAADALASAQSASEDAATASAAATDLNVVAVGTDLRTTNTIGTVAGSIANVNAVGGSILNVNTVANDISNINSVSGIISSVNTVAGISSDVSAVSSIASAVTAVSSNSTNINKVATDINRVKLVADDIASVHTVAIDISNVIDVADNKTNINAVAGDLTNINAVAADLTNIDNASTYAAEAKQWAIGDPTEPSAGSAKYWAQQASQGQVQSDWNQSDSTKKDYIKNKPNYGSSLSYSSNSLQLLDQSGNALGSAVTIKSSPDLDNKSITKNSSQELQTVGVIDDNGGNAIKTWTGTLAQYNAIATKDSNTLYNITDDMQASTYEAYSKNETDTLIANNTSNLLATLYPVGSIYIGTQSTCPLATLISGSTWVKVSEGRVLQGSDSNHNAGTTIEAGLPNITGQFGIVASSSNHIVMDDYSGSFYENGYKAAVASATSTITGTGGRTKLDASRSSSIYGNSNTVQPPAFVVNIWQRTA